MLALTFDLEADGLLDEATAIHCISIKNRATGNIKLFEPEGIDQAIEVLQCADVLIGHNIIGYDIEVIKKLYGIDVSENATVRDTMVMSMLSYPDIKFADMDREKKCPTGMPGRLWGGHTLEAWGWRMGEHKGDYKDWCKDNFIKEPFAVYRREMGEYCRQDVVVSDKLFNLCYGKFGERALNIEHQFHTLMSEMERDGVPFDEDGARKLYAELSAEREEIRQKLRRVFPAWWRASEVVTPPRTLKYKEPKKADRTEGAPFTPVKLQAFNPQSASDIGEAFRRYKGYKWPVYTTNGEPSMSSDVMSTIPFEEARDLEKLALLKTVLGRLGEGPYSLIKVVKNGRIHGRVKGSGAVTRRCTHSAPNVNMPRVGSFMGEELRSLFRAPPGYAQVGADLSGIELRMLGEYLWKWDDGEYARIVVEGDPHTVNAKAWGLPLPAGRSPGKNLTYGWLYGQQAFACGEAIIAASKKCGIEIETADIKKLGRERQKQFENAIPALGELRKTIADTVKQRKRAKGSRNVARLASFDGGPVLVRHEHAALNTLLQSAGAVVAKVWALEFNRIMKQTGLEKGYGRDWWLALHVHDEMQSYCREDCVDIVAKAKVMAATRAGEVLGLNVPIDAEAKIGRNWADCH